MAAGISDRDAQAEGHVVLRAGGDDPQGGACAGQAPATAGIVPSPPQTTNMRIPSARASWTTPDRSQPGSTRKASGTSFQACISWITSTIWMGDPLAAPRWD